MKKINYMLVCLLAGLSMAGQAANATESTAYAQVTTNYIFRGQTQTNDGAAIQGGYDIRQSKADTGWYAGVFASNVAKGLELDGFAGWQGVFGKKKNLGYDVGAILYKYTDNGFAKDTTEFYAGFSYETAYGKLFFGNGGGSYTYLDIGASFIVMGDLDMDVHYGRYLNSGINDLSAAVSLKVRGFDLGLGLTYADKSNTKFYATVKKEFDL